MSQLNANASEWRPTGNATTTNHYLTELALPPSVMVNGAEGDGTATTTSATAAAAIHNFSAEAAAFTPGRAVLASSSPSVEPAPYYPTFSTGAASEATGGVLGDIDWKVEFNKLMELTDQMIDQQMRPEQPATAAAGETEPQGATEEGAPAAKETPPAAPAKTYASVVSGGSKGIAAAGEKGKNGAASAVAAHTPAGGSGPSKAGSEVVSKRSLEKRFDLSDGRSLPPLTANGNRRWKKPTKAEQKREQAQRNAFEAFAGALLHSVSPFMAPLRAKCRKTLPHLKIDQRFGKSGQPQTAIAQFIAAPLVTNYRPRHFHDVSPGDLEEFMWELAHALDVMPSSYSLIVGYGPVWKRYAVPYLYIACKDYQKEVQALCPDEIPNSRTEAIYEDDVVKDITDVILAVNELDFLEEMSMLAAMKARAKFQPMFDAFDQIFAPLENYQVEITNLRERPSKFMIKVSELQVDQKPQPITLYGDPKLWYELPEVTRVVVKTAKTHHPAESTVATAAGDSDRPQAMASVAEAEAIRKGRRAMSESDQSSNSDHDSGDNDGDFQAGDGKGNGDQGRPRAAGGKSGKRERSRRSGNGGDGVPLWLVATPVVMSLLCAAATVGIIISKKK